MALGQKVENKSLVADDGFKQIGLTLKGARRSQGLSVKDVSEKLRISVDYLTKLEAGKLDELPAPDDKRPQEVAERAECNMKRIQDEKNESSMLSSTHDL